MDAWLLSGLRCKYSVEKAPAPPGLFILSDCMDAESVSKNIRFLAVFFCSAIVVFLYYPAISGALYYDDYSNLAGLADISDWGSALNFVFGGTAGPLGRPIALLSFVPFAAAWPENSAAVLFFNVILHAANFVVLYLLGYSILSRVERLEERNQFYAAITAALMWAVLPILASTSLIAIQRMAGLASFFGFLGLLGFVKAYSLYDRAPFKAFCLQFLSLGSGTLLSIYTKESGAVFPVFALLIDCFVRRSDRQLVGYSLLRRAILICPLVFIVYYLSPLKFDWFAFNEYRGGSPVQRLFNEFSILWEYVYRAFIPQAPRQYGPFHDYYSMQVIGLGLVVAGVAWGVTVILAVVLKVRVPWFFFAVFWFLIGHLVESTTILLELYFEHRNYVSIYGACLALSVCVFKFKGRLRKVVVGLFVFYIVLLAVILQAVTILWGDSKAAAESWVTAHPGSARAALHAVIIETGKDRLDIYNKNSDYISRERYEFYLRVLDRTKSACPDCVEVRIQALVYSCLISDDQELLVRLAEIKSIAESASINATVGDRLFTLAELTERNSCGVIGDNELIGLISELEKSRRLNVPESGAKVVFVKAMLQHRSGDMQGSWDSLMRAESISLDALPVLQYQVHLAVEMGRVDEAKRAIERRSDLVFQGKLDRLEVDKLKEFLDGV